MSGHTPWAQIKRHDSEDRYKFRRTFRRKTGDNHPAYGVAWVALPRGQRYLWGALDNRDAAPEHRTEMARLLWEARRAIGDFLPSARSIAP